MSQQRSNNYSQILKHRQRLVNKSAEQITFSKALIEREGMGIIYPRTINIVQGKTGVHKSRLVEEFCAVLLANTENENTQCPLGFQRVGIDHENLTVLYVDTERNINDQFPYAIQQIKRKSGHPIDVDLPSFDFISLIGIPRTDRVAALSEYLFTLRSKTNDHLFIVLDVITDCLSNFNDPSESMRLTDMMNKLINEHDVTFLCVTHENPSINSNKARGHLGTELSNKASCLLQIGFEKDKRFHDSKLVKINCLKTRMGAKPDPIYTRYCPEQKGLVLAGRDLISEVSDSRRTKATIQEVLTGLKDLLKKPLPRQDLIKGLALQLDCGSRTVIDRIKTIAESGMTFLNRAGNQCRLKAVSEGRKLVYGLHPIETVIAPSKPVIPNSSNLQQGHTALTGFGLDLGR